jgi:hypothetical protein
MHTTHTTTAPPTSTYPPVLMTPFTAPPNPLRAMQYEVSHSSTMNHEMANPGHYTQPNLYMPNGANRIKSETGSERGASPHTSEQSSRYSSQTPQNLAYHQQIASQLTNGLRYPSPSQIQQQSNMSMMQHSYHPSVPQDQQYQQQTPLAAVQQAVQAEQSPMEGRTSTGNGGLPKAFACSTCSKGFARRSDLARHGKNSPGGKAALK